MNDLTAVPIGFFVGIFGTLVGAGGGFILAPLLVILEPAWTTDKVTAFSLAVATANALAGSFAYSKLRRIDLRTFPLFAAAAIPGAVAGAALSQYIPRRVFDAVLGAFIIVGAALLNVPRQSRVNFGDTQRRLVDRAGVAYEWRFSLPLGLAGAAVVGLLSSLLGIGGGIIHVPFMVLALGYPEHVATATSHAVLAVTAGAATITHLVHRGFGHDAQLMFLTAGGALLGAPLGARLSTRFSGPAISRILALALVAVGIRLIVVALGLV